MRLVIAALAAQALALAGQPADAQSVGTAPLAANEVLFEVGVVGTARSQADTIFVNLMFSAGGRTSLEARSAAEALCERLVEIGRRFGAERAEGAGMPFGELGFVSEPPPPPDGEAGAGEAGADRRWGHGSLRLRLRDASRFAEMRAALEEAGALNIVGPIYQLADDSAARRRARADAMSRAREEADQFARSQDMRVARLLRFSEASDNQAEAMRTFMAQFGGGIAGGTSEVETRLPVQVAFALAPQ